MNNIGQKEQFYPYSKNHPTKIQGDNVKLKCCLDSQNNRQSVDAVRNTMFLAPFQAILDAKADIQVPTSYYLSLFLSVHYGFDLRSWRQS